MNRQTINFLAIISLATLVFIALPVITLAEGTKFGDVYLDKPELIRKWKQDRMPLTVYLKPGDGVPGFKPDYTQLAKDAFEQWSNASDGKVKFRFVDDPKQAMVRLSWTNDPAKLERIEPYQAGSTNCTCGDFGIDDARILLLTAKPVSTTKMTDNCMHMELLHEVGHALGLSHSGDTKDIMYPGFSDAVDTRDPVLSERDRRTISELYSDSVKYGYVPGDKNRKASKDPGVKVVPNADNAAGIAAMNKGDFAKAISIFEKLYDESPTTRTFKENLVGTLSNAANAANKKGSYDTAVGYLERALKIDPTFDAARQNLVCAIDGKADRLMAAGKPADAEPLYKKALDMSIPLSRKELLNMTVNNYSIALSRLGRQAEAAQLRAKYLSK